MTVWFTGKTDKSDSIKRKLPIFSEICKEKAIKIASLPDKFDNQYELIMAQEKKLEPSCRIYLCGCT
jgi:hypothetical protein